MKRLGESKLGRMRHLAFPGLSGLGLLYQHLVTPSKILIDVGCGSGSLLVALKKIDAAKKLKSLYTVGLDIYLKSLRSASSVYDDVVRCDIRHMPVKERIADITLCNHVIEHLDKREGGKLLRDLDAVSSRLVIVATPVGWVPHTHGEENTWQIHRSAWLPNELKELRFEVFGTASLKTLYGQHARRIWHFPPMYLLTDLVTHFLLIRRRPDLASQMICVKRIC